MSAWGPGVTSPIINLQLLDVMSVLRHPDASCPIRSVKLIGLLYLTARPLTGPLASVPASILRVRGTIEWKADAGFFFFLESSCK